MNYKTLMWIRAEATKDFFSSVNAFMVTSKKIASLSVTNLQNI